jgi:hypothetical protein
LTKSVSVPSGTVPCVGCRGLVPDEDGPIHRYMTASPGCWRMYTELGAGSMPRTARSPLTVDAYAVTHPGVPGPQSTPSVWIHLVTLCAVLEKGWAVEHAVRLRRVGADAFDRWPWLGRPDPMGDVSVVDVARAVEGAGGATTAGELIEAWIDAAWGAWSAHHPAVRTRTDELVTRFF